MYAETWGTSAAVIAAIATVTAMIRKRLTPEPLKPGSHLAASKRIVCSAQERFTKKYRIAGKASRIFRPPREKIWYGL
jgi:hypothetical protein